MEEGSCSSSHRLRELCGGGEGKGLGGATLPGAISAAIREVFVPRFALGAVLFQTRASFRFGRATCPSERSLFLFITGSDPLWLTCCNSSYALQSRCFLEYPDKLISLVIRSSFRIAHLRKDTSLASGLYKSACRSVGDGETVGDICGVHDRLFDEKLG